MRLEPRLRTPLLKIGYRLSGISARHFTQNPTTQSEAVAEFKKALDLKPDSVREQLNYALALLRAAKTQEAG